MTFRGTSFINNYINGITNEVSTENNVYFKFALLRFGSL
jgi:hypothetical protein